MGGNSWPDEASRPERAVGDRTGNGLQHRVAASGPLPIQLERAALRYQGTRPVPRHGPLRCRSITRPTVTRLAPRATRLAPSAGNQHHFGPRCWPRSTRWSDRAQGCRRYSMGGLVIGAPVTPPRCRASHQPRCTAGAGRWGLRPGWPRRRPVHAPDRRPADLRSDGVKDLGDAVQHPIIRRRCCPIQHYLVAGSAAHDPLVTRLFETPCPRRERDRRSHATPRAWRCQSHIRFRAVLATSRWRTIPGHDIRAFLEERT
jgi:hypothetical protein